MGACNPKSTLAEVLDLDNKVALNFVAHLTAAKAVQAKLSK